MSNFNISRTFKDVSDTLQSFTFMGTTVFEIAEEGPADLPSLVKGVSLGKGRVKNVYDLDDGENGLNLNE